MKQRKPENLHMCVCYYWLFCRSTNHSVHWLLASAVFVSSLFAVVTDTDTVYFLYDDSATDHSVHKVQSHFPYNHTVYREKYGDSKRKLKTRQVLLSHNKILYSVENTESAFVKSLPKVQLLPQRTGVRVIVNFNLIMAPVQETVSHSSGNIKRPFVVFVSEI